MKEEMQKSICKTLLNYAITLHNKKGEPFPVLEIKGMNDFELISKQIASGLDCDCDCNYE